MIMKNFRFPGRENYEGPTTGMFGLLHHTELCEPSHDVMERVNYVKHEKDPHEIPTRLHNMIWLGDCEAAAQWDVALQTYRANDSTLYCEFYEAKALLLEEAEEAECAIALDALNAKYHADRDTMNAESSAVIRSCESTIHEFIKQHIPDCAWDGEQLLFPVTFRALENA